MYRLTLYWNDKELPQKFLDMVNDKRCMAFQTRIGLPPKEYEQMYNKKIEELENKLFTMQEAKRMVQCDMELNYYIEDGTYY